MTLRTRLLWLFLPLLGLCLVGVWLLSDLILLGRFDRDDRQRLYDEVRQLHFRLDSERQRYLDLLRSYAWWDNTYRFVEHPEDPSFVAENIDLDLLSTLHFDFVVVLDANGHHVAERWAPLASQAPPVIAGASVPSAQALQAGILDRALALGALSGHDPKQALSQWLLVDGVPLLLVSSPISNTSGKLPPRGALIAGFLLDPHRQEALQPKLDSELHLLPGLAPDDDWRTLDIPQARGGVLISPRRLLGEQRQGLDLLYLDSRGQPQFRIAIEQPRQSWQQGREAIRLFLGMALLIVLSAVSLAYFALETWVIRRIRRLNQQVSVIGQSAHLERIGDMGRDELGQLASEVNHMLGRLERSEARDRAILDSIRDGYFEMDRQGVILTVNSAFCRMLGYNAEMLVGRSYQDLLDAPDVERSRGLYQQVRTGAQETTFVAPFKRLDGQRVTFETRVSAILDQQGEFAGFRGILRDISLQVAYQKRLLDLAYHDPLTGLGNRKAFTEQLPLALQHANSQVALLYIDLDHFKQVNDRFGHAAGDALLSLVGERLRGSLRRPDMAYRLGGDEFAVILDEANGDIAETLGERLLDVLGETYSVAGQALDFLTPSIGIAMYPDDAEQAEALIHAADIAMYEAKQQRNRYQRYQPHYSVPPPAHPP